MPTPEMLSIAVGTEAARIENPGGFMLFQDLTRDGRFLIFTSPGPRPEIWSQRVGTPSERRLLVKAGSAATQGRVSPDGRWLAYTVIGALEPNVFVQPFDRPGGRIQVSRGGGFGAVWRGDGRELYYEAANALMAVTMTERGGALEAGTPQKLFAVRTQGFIPNQPHNVAVAANGQKFLVNTIVGDGDNAPLEVTLNWTAGLRP